MRRPCNSPMELNAISAETANSRLWFQKLHSTFGHATNNPPPSTGNNELPTSTTMSTQGSLAGRSTFDALDNEYENGYKDTDIKQSCTTHAISLIPAYSKVLDVGCGTGVPVSQMLFKAGLFGIGFDISPRMVALAKTRFKGDFSVSDMLAYGPVGSFAGVFMISPHLQLSYKDFLGAVWKFANALQPGGILVLGQCRVIGM